MTVMVALSTPDSRSAYFDELGRLARGRTSVFFDPDNGLSVESVRKGRKNSAKYLYWDELDSFLASGPSTITYQHFPRVPREAYLAALLERVRAFDGQHVAFALYSPRVAYIVAARAPYAERFLAAGRSLVRQWCGTLRLFV
jgi:hypothetical protein